MERQTMYNFQGRRKNKQKDGLCGSKLEYQQSLQTSHGLPILCIICGDLSIESQFSDTKWLPITDQPAWQHSQNSPILISVTINIIRIEYFLQNDSRALQWSPQPKQVTSRLTMLLGAHAGVSLPAQVIKRWRMWWCGRALGVLECKLVWASDSLEPEIHVPRSFTGSTWPPPHVLQLLYQTRRSEAESPHFPAPWESSKWSATTSRDRNGTELKISVSFPTSLWTICKRDLGLPWKLPGHHQCVPWSYFFTWGLQASPGFSFTHLNNRRRRQVGSTNLKFKWGEKQQQISASAQSCPLL